MDPRVGRFTQQDAFAGLDADPTTLNKHLYAHSNPSNYSDPSGYISLSEVMAAVRTQSILMSRAVSSNARHFVRRAYSETLRSSKEAARLARECLRRPRGCNLIGPTLIISGADMPVTASHIRDAQFGSGSSIQMGPAPFLLHYQNKPDALRQRALAPYRGPGQICSGSSLLQFCDEYPFFKTREGSPRNLPGRVSLRLAPASEQRRQGGLFNGMISACGIRQAPMKKSRFLVIPLPEFELPSSFLCLK